MRSKKYRLMTPHGFHDAAYTEWGDPDNPQVLVCVHGLTRNGRDFDFLAQALADRYRVVCPDVLGRGKSDWLAFRADYGYPLYVAQMGALITHLDVESLDWVGTSMGALIGMMVAGLPGNPIRRLVMNDVGPFIPKPALERLAIYVGKGQEFDSIEALEANLREIAAPFGRLSDEHWRHLAVHGSYQHEGRFRFAYDPAIGEAFREPLADIDLWLFWSLVRCPVLVIRGADSDLLLADTLEKMKQRPNTESVEVPGVGHAPPLMDPAQIAPVREFLIRP